MEVAQPPSYAVNPGDGASTVRSVETAAPEHAWTEIGTVEELVGLLGEPNACAPDKGRTALLDVDRDWLAAAPFCVLATSSADGRCDASPKGDPAGSLVHVTDEMVVKGHRPLLAVVVEIEEVFFHCAKAFLRSGLWIHETWDLEGVVPRRAVIAATVEPSGLTPEQLDDYYRPENYERGLYA